MIEVVDLHGGYGKKTVLHNFSFSISKGEFFGIIGPNGSGKSTLLRFLSGVFKPATGQVLLEGKSIYSISRKKIAQMIAVLPQEQVQPYPFRVRDIVAMGRYPYQKGILPFSSERDEEVIEKVLQHLQLKNLENSMYNELSGGQKQRTILARVLVQEPKVILLDEPTNHLDVFYQVEVLNQLSSWIKERNITVVSVLHDINLTSLYADRVLLLSKEGTMHMVGAPEEVLTAENIYSTFGLVTVETNHPIYNKPQFFLQSLK